MRAPARRRLRAALLLAGLAAAGCAPLTIPEERQLGEQVNRQMRQEVRLVRDEVVLAYVQAIGQRIVAAAGTQPFSFRFYVAESDQVNAFALPAGYVYTNTGTLLRAVNASEVAGVLAHEVGHVVRRHVAGNYRRSQGVGILRQLGVLSAAVIGGAPAANAASLGGGLAAAAYLNSFGREAERESDAFAVQVLPRAGYDPGGMVSFFETLLRESGGAGPPAFLSSHPTTGERIDATRAMIAAQGLPAGLQVHDGGRLEIIQQRIRLLRRNRR